MHHLSVHRELRHVLDGIRSALHLLPGDGRAEDADLRRGLRVPVTTRY
jgi:hypothetical protein